MDTEKGLILTTFLILAGIIFVTSFLGIVGAGKRGVYLRWGAVTGKILDEGLYFKIPISLM